MNRAVENFLSFCIEITAERLRKSEEETAKLLKEYGAEDFIQEVYEVEHALPHEIIIEDIMQIMRNNGWKGLS